MTEMMHGREQIAASSTDDETIPVDLPEQLIMEILIRLPIKSVLRFQCVSKSWRAMICSLYFRKKHHYWNSSETQILLWIGTPSQFFACPPGSITEKRIMRPSRLHSGPPLRVQYEDENLKFSVNHSTIIGSCNGLVCLLYRSLRHNVRSLTHYFLGLWNPILNEFNKLPICPAIELLQTGGFGYDPVHDDYKAIIVDGAQMEEVDADGNVEFYAEDMVYQIRSPKLVFVYSLSTNSWKSLEGFGRGYLLDYGKMGTYLNGVVHWIAESEAGVATILAIDLATETSRGCMQGPRKGFSRRQWAKHELCILDGCLCVGGFTVAEACTFKAWVLKEYGNQQSWIKLFSGITCGPCSYFTRMVSPVRIFNNGQTQVLLYCADDGKFYLYNSEDSQCRRIDVYGGRKLRRSSLTYTDYVPTFVSPLAELPSGAGC